MANNISLSNSLTQVSPQKKKALDPYREVAKGMETQFARYMIEQMRKTINKNEPESSAMNFYQSTMADKRAEMMSDANTLGLQEMILEQIAPGYQKGKSPERAQQAYHAEEANYELHRKH